MGHQRREKPRVVQTGPYAWVRHPLYTYAYYPLALVRQYPDWCNVALRCYKQPSGPPCSGPMYPCSRSLPPRPYSRSRYLSRYSLSLNLAICTHRSLYVRKRLSSEMMGSGRSIAHTCARCLRDSYRTFGKLVIRWLHICCEKQVRSKVIWCMSATDSE